MLSRIPSSRSLPFVSKSHSKIFAQYSSQDNPNTDGGGTAGNGRGTLISSSVQLPIQFLFLCQYILALSCMAESCCERNFISEPSLKNSLTNSWLWQECTFILVKHQIKIQPCSTTFCLEHREDLI